MSKDVGAKVEILVIRDPDSYTDIMVWIDGVQTTVGVTEESVDPGAGHLLSEWRESTQAVRDRESYSPAFRDAVVAARVDYDHSQFIEDDEDEERD